MVSRRSFIKSSAALGAATALSARWSESWAFAQTSSVVPLFGTALRGIGTIGVAAADLTPAPVTGVTHYTINIDEFQDAGVCPALGATTLRGFNPTRLLAGQNNTHLGGIIVGQKGVPIQITFRNNLPGGMHIIPNDLTIMGAMDGNDRACVHFHGGLVPWISDGGPMSWWSPAGVKGPSFLNNAVLNPAAALNEAEYYYPLNQSARFGWYHDHTFGITRINAYAGMASGLLIRDTFERGLIDGSGGIAQGLPNYIEAGGNEIPLVIQDKIFVGLNTAATDPTWAAVSKATTPGSLWYAHVYERNRWKAAGNVKGAGTPDPSVIPEFFGDTMLVNGTTFPKVTVEARRYRLRFLNACNARFLNLQLYVADASPNGITLNAFGNPANLPALCDPNLPGAAASVLQIGTEGGFLQKPARVPTNVPFNPMLPLNSSLVVAPAERPDVLIDFSAYVGKSIILYNDAPSPFPMGDPRNDYFPLWNVKGNPVNALTPAGFGPNTRVLMRFDVVAATGTDLPLTITPTTDLSTGIDAPLVPFGVSVPPLGIPVRQLTLNEAFDANGRLLQMLGTMVPPLKNGGLGRAYLDLPTEVVPRGTTEVWEIFNTTADVHPMHFHLVNVQLINRQPFQVSSLGNTRGGANFTGPATPAEKNETGWKETVMMFPGTVTRIIMRFDVPQILTAAGTVIPTPVSPRTGGNEYVWHCHILEHEEHDMMRPLIVT